VHELNSSGAALRRTADRTCSMILTTLITKVNKHLATPLLRSGLTLRVSLGGGVIRPNPYLDYLSLVPWAQRLVSFEVRSAAQQIRAEQDREPTAFDKFVDVAWDRLFENASRAMSPPPPSPSSQAHVDNPQLQALQTYLRPALVPNEQWGDVVRWYFNTRFVKWARMEYLAAKYGDDVRMALSMPKYGDLSSVLPMAAAAATNSSNNAAPKDASISISSSPPPSASTLIKAFNMKHWTKEKNSDAVSDRMREIVSNLGGRVVPIPGSVVLFPDIKPDTDVSSLSLEDILELAGGHVSSCGPFNVVCEEAGLYEFWTREYIDALATYLLDRANAVDGDTVVLDVGAGDGMLAHFLRNSMAVRSSSRGKAGSASRTPTIVATDDGSWRIRPRFDVETLDVREAMSKHRDECQQLIVLCSWMPMGVDWTAHMRTGGADEIILIGECDDGNCGDNWATWGNPEFREEDAEDELQDNNLHVPSYEIDGYKRNDLVDLSRLQFSRFDSSVSSNSKSVSFRK